MPDQLSLPWEHYTDWLERLGVPTNVVTASVTLVMGLLLALLARRMTRALVRRGGRVLAGLAPGDLAPRTQRIENTMGAIVYWGVLLFFVMAATETLGLPVVTGWLAQVANYVPRIVAAILIVALGTLAARLAREVVARTAHSASAPGAERLARAAEIALLVATGLVAIEQLGIEVSFLKSALLILLAAVVGGSAIAFGLGGRQVVGNVLAQHYVQKTYQVGQTIRFQDVQGRIVRMTDIAVIVESGDGEVVIPAGQLARQCSTLVLKAGAR
jgi:uncharacterized membrane protein